ncbi:MAG: Ig-like domain-containing protein, partial [Chloroflexota bacterium]
TRGTFDANAGASVGGGAISNNFGSTLNINNSQFTNHNISGPGGAIISEGDLTVIGSSFVNNSSSAGSDGGAIYNRRSTLTVQNSVFINNNAPGFASAEGGAIYNGGGGTSSENVTLNVTNSKFVGNAAFGNGDAIYINDTDDDGIVTNSCFVGNDVAIYDDPFDAATLGNLNNNFWGTNDGPLAPGNPNGLGDEIIGITDATRYNNFLTGPNFTDFDCPTIVPDLYSMDLAIDTQLVVTDADGVLANDIAVRPGTATVNPIGLPSFGTVTVNPGGGFTYNANTPSQDIDGFRYRAEDLDGGNFTGLVCITRSTLDIQVPGTQTAAVGVPLAIPGVQVVRGGSTTSTDQVRVNLTVSQGIISVTDPGTGDGLLTLPSPADECRTQLNALRMLSAPTLPDVVDASPFTISGGVGLPGSGLVFAPLFQVGPVDVVGNNSASITLEGSVADVNIVLSSLTYTASSVGVDNLVIVANDASMNVAFEQVTIIIGGTVPPTAGGGGGTTITTSSSAGSDDGGGGQSSVAVIGNIPLGPNTLFELSQIPNTVIIGDAPGGTVTGGDVFAQVLVVNGQIVGNTAAIGDPSLLEQPLGNGAELFGLSGAGASVSSFNNSIRVCLRGSGSFTYRDATGMPRQTVTLPTTTQGAFTCANIPNAGTIVLINSGDVMLEETAARALPDGCMVTTRNIINLREAPGLNSNIIRRVPFDVTLSAFELDAGYVFVDYLGQRGWLSLAFVTPNEACGL